MSATDGRSPALTRQEWEFLRALLAQVTLRVDDPTFEGTATVVTSLKRKVARALPTTAPAGNREARRAAAKKATSARS